MKNIMVLFVVFLLASCSSDDKNTFVVPDKVDGTLLKKAVYTNPDGQTSVAEYTYNGNKLLKIEANSGASTSYQYTGDRITRINYNFGSLNTESLWLTYSSNGKLESLKKIVVDAVTYSVTYTDNDDQTVTVREYNGDFATGATMVGQSTVFIAEDGSVTKIEKQNATITYNFTYDDKTPPTAGIIGYDKLRFYHTGTAANPHNLLAVTGTANLTMINTYNAQGCLSTAKEGEDGPSVKYYYY